jgi:transcriptional regulator with XRE-family HTH domain
MVSFAIYLRASVNSPEGPNLGERVAELRHEAGLDQRALADIVKRSMSWVSQVERGEIIVGDVGMLQRLAAALGVPSRELVELVLGEDAADEERQRPYVEALRLALAGHPNPAAILGLRSKRAGEVTLERLEADLVTAGELMHASAFDRLGPLLAKVLPSLEALSRDEYEPDERQRAMILLANAYQAAAAMLVKVGDAGGGWIAADRAIAAGERCGDRRLVMAGQLRMAHTFVGSSENDLAIHVLRQAAGVARQLNAETDPSILSLTGACALLLAVLEARKGDTAEAHRHLKAAKRLARHLGADRNDYGTEFGPTNVALHEVAVEVELGNAAAALELAAKVDATRLSAERRSRFLVDIARAHVQRRAAAPAVKALSEAEAIAPAEIADSRLVREMVASQLRCKSSGRRLLVDDVRRRL